MGGGSGQGRPDLGGFRQKLLPSLGISIPAHDEIGSVLCPQHAVYSFFIICIYFLPFFQHPGQTCQVGPQSHQSHCCPSPLSPLLPPGEDCNSSSAFLPPSPAFSCTSTSGTDPPCLQVSCSCLMEAVSPCIIILTLLGSLLRFYSDHRHEPFSGSFFLRVVRMILTFSRSAVFFHRPLLEACPPQLTLRCGF